MNDLLLAVVLQRWRAVTGTAAPAAGDRFADHAPPAEPPAALAADLAADLARDLAADLGSVLGVPLTGDDVARCGTAAALAEHIATVRDDRDDRAREADLPEDRLHPASDGQAGIWFIGQYAADPTVYNSPISMRVRSALDPALLERALRRVVGRHESLRTTFELVDGTVMQRISAEPEVRFEVADAPAGADLNRLVDDVARTDFDLRHGPLLRVVCARRGPGDTRLLCNVHHAVFDGFSWQVFLPELFAAYRDLAEGREPGGTDRPWQFRDVQDRPGGPAAEESLTYWKDKLGGVAPLLDLPLDRPRPPVQAFAGGAVPFAVPERTLRGLRERARAEGVTPLMFLLAAYAVFLHKHTGRRELPVGMPASLRDRPEAQTVVGHLINTVTLLPRVTGDMPVRELLGQVKTEVVESMRHRALPFEKVVEAVNPGRSTGHAPIFQTMVTHLRKDRRAYRVPGLDVEPWRHVSHGAKYDLVLLLEEEPDEDTDRLGGVFEYDTALFLPETVRAMAERFLNLLAEMADRPDATVADLRLLTPRQERELLAAWDAPADERVGREPVAEIFQRQARRTPDATAVEFEDRALTYRELNESANRLARALRGRGAAAGARVGIFLDRGPEMIVALLAVLKSGAAYVPLDPAYPQDRIEYMLADSAASVVVTCGSLAGRLPVGTCVFDLDAGAGPHPATDPPRYKSPRDEIYVVYTSGSTGRPKGVIINDLTVANLVHRQIDISGANAAARTLQYMSLSFDVSVEEILGTLCAGGTLVVVGEELRTDLHRLVAFVDERRIARLFLPYIALHQIAGLVARNRTPLPHLAEVYSTGEQLVVTPALREMFAHHTGARLFNIYGPSESHLCTVHRLPADPAAWGETPPIGHAVTGVKLPVLDEHRRPVPFGVPGELYVGGDILSPGYNGLPEQTRERFLADPFDPGARLYRTGDLVKYTADHELNYLGRVDDQVKVRGYRVEPAEIEAALNGLDFVETSAVVAADFGPGDRRLIAYLVAARPAPAAELRRLLGGTLPDYMIPWRFAYLDAVPTTPSGKIDRRALPAPADTAPRGPREHAREPTATERRLLAIWSGLLESEDVGLDDDFFALGGHSILAVRLMQAVREEFGADIALGTLLGAPTVAGMAARLSGAGDDPGEPDLWADVRLPDGLTADGTAPAESRHVLLTGATGFLGIYLLRSLLAAGRTVHCLVRAGDAAQARSRLLANARRYGLEADLDPARIEVVPGDLAEDRFGLDAAAYARLAGEVGAVYHAAAHINFAAPYASVKPTNVDGFVRVLEFAAERTRKPVHHMSTPAVFSPRQPSGVVTEDGVPAEPRGLGIGYAQSKWVAERLALAARERGVPVTIHRIGRIGGDSATGACRADDFFWLQLKSFVELGLAPAEPGPPVDLLPVDFVADAVTRLSLAESAPNRTLHVFHPEGLSWDAVFAAIRAAGYGLDLVPADDWLAALADRSGEDGGYSLASLVPLFEEGVLELGDHLYTNEATARELRALGTEFPAADGAWITAMIGYFRATGELATVPAP
ncbi:non-ribosomal peptide synthetase family protein [Actinomadura craniellae]|uniref:non-ribosomal peptide synthetase family protein n=1 Tax=Actinomadura craniellae TaxID=2231787 RepID=UPI001314C65E|nr:non-ribosomal peptide synthetase [Actinomadura craniellae]